MKLRITILKYHSWYLYQISLQIMLLPILIERVPFDPCRREKLWLCDHATPVSIVLLMARTGVSNTVELR